MSDVSTWENISMVIWGPKGILLDPHIETHMWGLINTPPRITTGSLFVTFSHLVVIQRVGSKTLAAMGSPLQGFYEVCVGEVVTFGGIEGSQLFEKRGKHLSCYSACLGSAG